MEENKGETKKIPFPKSTFFILAHKLFERVTYYGFQNAMLLYFTRHLLFEEGSSSILFDVFSCLYYLSAVFGAILADSVLGKFKTILYLSLTYGVGGIILSLASTERVGLLSIISSLVGLVLIRIGSGAISPCIVAIAGDQFTLPKQDKQLGTFFSFYYFFVIIGSVGSGFLTEILRKDASCYSEGNCFTLAFSVPTAVIVVSMVIFLCGKPLYQIKPPRRNIVMKVFRCLKHGISKARKTNPGRMHWLDMADDVFDMRLIEDIKCLMNILLMIIPLALFWALFLRQEIKWIHQVDRMENNALGFPVQPYHMLILQAILMLIFIPILDKVLYPFFGKFNFLKTPLQKLGTGGLFAVLAFLMSGLLELHIQASAPTLPKVDQLNLNFVNTLPCNLSVNLGSGGNFANSIIMPNENYVFEFIKMKRYFPEVRIIPNEEFGCKSFKEGLKKEDLGKTFEINRPAGGSAYTILVVLGKTKEMELVQPFTSDDLSKSNGFSQVKVVYDRMDKPLENVSVSLQSDTFHPYTFSIRPNLSYSYQQLMKPSEYSVTLHYTSHHTDEYEPLGKIRISNGGNYILSIARNEAKLMSSVGQNQLFTMGLHTITKPNSVHILWILPQIILISLCDIIFAIAILEFTYSQAPDTLKTVVQAIWIVFVGLGHLILVGIGLINAKFNFFVKETEQIFFYSGLMATTLLIFVWMAYFYTNREVPEDSSENGSSETVSKNQSTENDNDGFDEMF